MKSGAISDKRLEYRCPYMQIYHRRADFGAYTKDYYVVEFRRRGGVVAVRNGEVLLVRQYRFLLDGESLELPGGTIENEESVEAGLARECLEETGIRVRDLRPIVTYYPGLDNVDNRTTVFCSENVEQERPFISNPAEVLGIEWVSIASCLEMIFAGRILDAMTVAGIFGYAIQTRESRQPCAIPDSQALG